MTYNTYWFRVSLLASVFTGAWQSCHPKQQPFHQTSNISSMKLKMVMWLL